MRNLFIIVVVFFFNSTILGQNSKILIGFDIQTSLSSLYGSDYLSDFDRRISCSFGFSLDFLISDNNSIKSGIYYDRKGITTDVYVGTSPQINAGSALTLTYDYITIPILGTLSTKGKTKAFLTVGPSFGYLTSQKWIVKSTSLTQKITLDNTSATKRFDIGFTFGAGLNIFLSESLYLGIEVRNNIGLIDTNEYETNIEKTKICGLLIGLRYRPK